MLVTTLLGLAGCTVYPMVRDTGSPRMEPKNGRLVRVQGGAICYFDLESTGKYEDTLLAAESQAARRVQIVGDNGQPVPPTWIPREFNGSTYYLIPLGDDASGRTKPTTAVVPKP